MAGNTPKKNPEVAPVAVYVPVLMGMLSLMLTLNRPHDDGPAFTAATGWGILTGIIVALGASYIANRMARRRAE